jgi:hypothetical protein
MNHPQKIILAIGALAVLVMTLFPPAYAPYALYPQYIFIIRAFRIDFNRWLIQLVAILIICAVAWFIAKRDYGKGL